MKIIEMKNLGILSLFLLLVFSACRKDVNDVVVSKDIPQPGIENFVPDVETIVGAVTGFIVDENEEPVEGALIRFNDQTFTTDAYGHFFIENESMNALGTLVQVEKEGYFKGSRRFFPQAGATSRIKIQLLVKSFDDSFAASAGGTATMGNGASVTFAPGSIKTADGNAYDGTVHVASQWMDPSALSTLDQMPGNLQGINSEVEEVALSTYGMIAVELEGDAGQALNIADDHTATISMPVPASMQASAPAEIPLWSYHETYGLWVEEGKATLQNGAYVGEVSHFSFWNCDIPFDYVLLKMRLVEEASGNALFNFKVVLTTSGSTGAPTTSGSGYTDQDGLVSGAIPVNTVLQMKVFDQCGALLYTQDIGPFDMDIDLGDVIISVASGGFTTVTGNLLDCNGNPLNNGLVTADFLGTRIYEYPTSSNFTMDFFTCGSTSDIEVKAINLADLVESNTYTVPPFVQTDLSDISVCGNQLQNYILITVAGETAIYSDPQADIAATGTYLFAGNNNDEFIGFGFSGTTVGDYGGNNYIEVLYDLNRGWSFQGGTMDNFEVTEMGTHIKGSFSGEIINATGTSPISGTFDFEL